MSSAPNKGFTDWIETKPPDGNGELEKRLWGAADELRANSKLKSAEYSIPVLGLIFLRFADHRFAKVAKNWRALPPNGVRSARLTIRRAPVSFYVPKPDLPTCFIFPKAKTSPRKSPKR